MLCSFVIVHLFLLRSLSPQKCPVPKRPTLGVLDGVLQGSSPSASNGDSSSEKGQHSSAEVDLTGVGGVGAGRERQVHMVKLLV